MIYTEKVRIYQNQIDYCIVILCIYCINIHFCIIKNDSYYLISMFISILTIIYFYRQIILIYIAIQCTDQNGCKRVTMYYMVVTVYVYRYNCIEYHWILCGVLDSIVYYSSWYNMDSWGNDVYCDGGNMVSTKKRIMCNAWRATFCHTVDFY